MAHLTQDMVKRQLEGAGLKPTPQQVEGTTNLYNILDDQLAKVSPKTLERTEPHYIQPTRRAPQRRRR